MFSEILTIVLSVISLIIVFIGILSIKKKAVRKYFLFIAILTSLFIAALFIANAQEKPSEKKDKQIIMQYEGMPKMYG